MTLDEQAKTLVDSCQKMMTVAQETGAKDAENIFYLTTHVVSKQQEELTALRKQIESTKPETKSGHGFISLVTLVSAVVVVASYFANYWYNENGISFGGMVFHLVASILTFNAAIEGTKIVHKYGFRLFKKTK
jgi:hypothetical protein